MSTESEDQAAEQLKELVGAVLFGGMKMMVDRDISPAKALRLVSVEFLEAAYGPKVWEELGLPRRTVNRWRLELRNALKAAADIEDEPPVSVLEAFARLEQNKPGKP
jgi:hypothetical protein